MKNLFLRRASLLSFPLSLLFVLAGIAVFFSATPVRAADPNLSRSFSPTRDRPEPRGPWVRRVHKGIPVPRDRKVRLASSDPRDRQGIPAPSVRRVRKGILEQQVLRDLSDSLDRKDQLVLQALKVPSGSLDPRDRQGIPVPSVLRVHKGTPVPRDRKDRPAPPDPRD